MEKILSSLTGCDGAAGIARLVLPWSRMARRPGLDRAPDPFGDLRDHVAEQQQRRGPDERRNEIGDLELPVRHFEYAGRERHRRPQRTEEAADEDARHAPPLHEGLAARQDLGIARQ